MPYNERLFNALCMLSLRHVSRESMAKYDPFKAQNL